MDVLLQLTLIHDGCLTAANTLIHDGCFTAANAYSDTLVLL